MCTSIVVNKNKTIVGWNLDLLDMEYRVRPADEGVYIKVNDAGNADRTHHRFSERKRG